MSARWSEEGGDCVSNRISRGQSPCTTCADASTRSSAADGRADIVAEHPCGVFIFELKVEDPSSRGRRRRNARVVPGDSAIDAVRGEWLDRGAGGVVKKGGRIVSIRTLDGAWRPTGKAYAGKVFLDCSYEGDLMAAAGVSYVVGRESNGTYGETLNGYQPKQANHELVAGIDPYVTKGDATSFSSAQSPRATT